MKTATQNHPGQMTLIAATVVGISSVVALGVLGIGLLIDFPTAIKVLSGVVICFSIYIGSIQAFQVSLRPNSEPKTLIQLCLLGLFVFLVGVALLGIGNMPWTPF